MAYEYERTKGIGQGGLSSFISRLTNVHIAIPLMFIMLFLWLNAEAFWGANWDTSTALAYMIMFGFVLSVTRNSSLIWLTKTRLKEGVMNFWLGFVLMFAGLAILSMYVFKGSLGNNTISASAVYPSIAMTAFFVAPTEETIFRGVLKEYMKGWRLWFIPLGIVLTSGLFAVTHYAVYGGATSALLWAFIMGCVFYLMTSFKPSKRYAELGVPGAIGAHTCYNLFILGILSGGVV